MMRNDLSKLTALGVTVRAPMTYNPGVLTPSTTSIPTATTR